MEGEGGPDRQVVYLPTYRTGPSESDKFYPSEVKKHAEDVINEILSQNTEYDEDTCYQYTLDITNGIKDRVKEKCHMPRYKIVCQVTLGQRKDQGMRFCSRCLWDTNTDNYATASFKNEHLYCVATVFGLYTL